MTNTLISPQDLAAMDEVVVIDTRAPEAFGEGHIPGR